MLKILEVKNRKARYRIKKRGKYLFFLNNFSGYLDVEIESEGVQAFIIGLYFGQKNDNFKIKTIQHHKKGKSSSDLLIKGVFLDNSNFYYDGLIKIEKGADKSFAYQKNQSLVLSSKSFIESKPYLEILANDVFCTHGSTTSYLNKDKLYYLESRGLDRKKRKKLLVEAFLAEVFEKINKILSKEKLNKFLKIKKDYLKILNKKNYDQCGKN